MGSGKFNDKNANANYEWSDDMNLILDKMRDSGARASETGGSKPIFDSFHKSYVLDISKERAFAARDGGRRLRRLVQRNYPGVPMESFKIQNTVVILPYLSTTSSGGRVPFSLKLARSVVLQAVQSLILLEGLEATVE